MSRYTSQRLSIKGMKENQVVVRNAHGRKRLFIKHANKLYSTSLYSNTKSDRVIKLIRNDLRVTGPLKVGSEGYLSLTDNEIDISSGNLTIDVAGDITLDADGGEVSFKDGEATIGEFSSASSISKLSLYSQADKGDLFKVETTTHGATTITTIDDDATAANLTLDVDGYVTMHTNGAQGVRLTNASDVLYAHIRPATSTLSTFVLASQEDASDTFSIAISTNGQTFIATDDSSGSDLAHLSFTPDGDIALNSGTNNLNFTLENVTHTSDIDDTTPHTTSAYTLDLDVDGIIAGGQTGTNIGINLDVNSDSPTMVGAVYNYGMDIDVVGGTSGIQVNYGIDLSVTGADTNTGMRIDTTGNHLMLRYNANDYAWMTVLDTGDLVVATAGDGTTDSDLTLDIDGDIELNADGGDIAFKDASADLAALSSSGLTISNISEVGSDTDKILMSDSGVVKYVTGANLRSYIGAGTGDGDMTGVDLTGGTGISIDSETNTTSGAYSSTITCNLEGTEVISTGEGGGSKFLREDGDGTCSWNTVSTGATTFQLEDGDGTEVTISNAKEVKFVEGENIDINWTDTDAGSDADPFDLTFTVKMPYVLYSNFQDDMGTSKHYLPLRDVIEQTVTGTEQAGMMAPFNMTLQKVVMRSNTDVSGATYNLGMFAIDSGTTDAHHHTNGLNWVQATGGAQHTNATFDFTGTVGLAGSGSGGSNAVTAGQLISFQLYADTDVTSFTSEFWLSFLFHADMSNTI